VGVTGVQRLEWFELGNGELIVNVTEIPEISEVTKELGESWTWESIEQFTQPAEEGEGITEWLILIGATRKELPQAAA
jgi:hypothetical protein